MNVSIPNTLPWQQHSFTPNTPKKHHSIFFLHFLTNILYVNIGIVITGLYEIIFYNSLLYILWDIAIPGIAMLASYPFRGILNHKQGTSIISFHHNWKWNLNSNGKKEWSKWVWSPWQLHVLQHIQRQSWIMSFLIAALNASKQVHLQTINETCHIVPCFRITSRISVREYFQFPRIVLSKFCWIFKQNSLVSKANFITQSIS